MASTLKKNVTWIWEDQTAPDFLQWSVHMRGINAAGKIGAKIWEQDSPQHTQTSRYDGPRLCLLSGLSYFPWPIRHFVQLSIFISLINIPQTHLIRKVCVDTDPLWGLYQHTPSLWFSDIAHVVTEHKQQKKRCAGHELTVDSSPNYKGIVLAELKCGFPQ